MKRQTLMVQGTTSDAGKSAVVTGLCRLLRRRGLRVAPFKPQNMALNSAVTIDGGEIGRAQAVQAQACGLEPHTDMNPILLKPNTDTGAQVIVNGKAVGNMEAVSYHAYKPQAMQAVLAAHARLCEAYDLVVVEGAGSPAEINLRDRDVANMGFAEAVDCPVILVADIDRGGVFAHLVGTLDLLSESERQRTEALIINKFRGDIALLKPGNDWLEQRSGKPLLGTLPFLQGLYLEAEDALRQAPHKSDGPLLRVVVPALPRISNHTDFDALQLHPQVEVTFVRADQQIPAADLMILPGSKSVAGDLAFLRRQGWEQAIRRHLRYGGKVLGICGGFQMLGQRIDDPDGVESQQVSSPGLGLLDFTTCLHAHKQLHRVGGQLLLGDCPVIGYEIHAGLSKGPALQQPLVVLDDGRSDGVISDDGLIAGSYLHGLLDSPEALQAILRWAGLQEPQVLDLQAQREEGIDRLADMLEAHLDLPLLERIIGRAI